MEKTKKDIGKGKENIGRCVNGRKERKMIEDGKKKRSR